MEGLEFPIDPVDMEYHIAAQHNTVLRELRLMRQLEGIPPGLEGHSDRILSLCAEHGMDEENDAEARAFLEHTMNGGSRNHNIDDPLNDAWVEALTAYEMFKADENNEDAKVAFESEFDAYKTLVEDTYGVEFTHDVDPVKDTSWDLLGIRLAHVAIEEMARALGIAVGTYFNLDWDDATAFHRTMGKITIHNSSEPAPKYKEGPLKGKLKAIAVVEGKRIKVYWNDKLRRKFYLIPNVVLHELGHILNANGAFGVDQFKSWLNFLEDHPGSREGMGAPDERVLIGKKVIYSYQSKIILPTLAQDIDIWDPDHVIFDKVSDEFPTQIQSLQQSTEDTKNEITADAKLNWVKFLITGGRFGFTIDEKGLNWQQVMEANMDEIIRNAIVHNMKRNEGPIDVSHLGGYPKIHGLATVRAAKGLNARSTPALKGKENVVTTLRDGQKLAILGISEDEAWIASERYGVLVWVSRGTKEDPLLILPEDLNIEDLPVFRADKTLDLDP